MLASREVCLQGPQSFGQTVAAGPRGCWGAVFPGLTERGTEGSPGVIVSFFFTVKRLFHSVIAIVDGAYFSCFA